MRLWFGISLTVILALGVPAQAGDEAAQKRLLTCRDAHDYIATEYGPVSPTLFKGRFQDYKPTTVQENSDFIRVTIQDPTGRHLYFHVENSVLKPLNDIYLEDRELSQALTNHYKSLFFKNLTAETALHKALIAQFSDYKTVRLAFSEDTPEHREALKRVYEKTAKQYEAALEGYLALHERLTGADHPLVEKTKLWHQAGIGRHADEAGWSSRYARKEAGDSKVPTIVDFRDPNTVEAFQNSYANTESRRRALQNELETYPGIMVPIAATSGTRVLSRAALEILRRVHPVNASQDAPMVIARFKERFGVSLTTKQALMLIEYTHSIDRFVPNINVVSHDPMSLGEAEFGYAAIDLAGQNVRNLDAAARALVQAYDGKPKEATAESIIAYSEYILAKLRRGQDEASAEFETIQKEVREAVRKLGVRGDETFSPANGVRTSGDDVVFAPDGKPLSRESEAHLLDLLAATGHPSHFRVTFGRSTYAGNVHGVAVREHDRATHVVLGDSIEKSLRKALETKISYLELENIVIGVEMIPHLTNETEVRILVGGKTSPDLLEHMRALTPSVLKEASKDSASRLSLVGIQSTSQILGPP
ncbi:MAG: hypothetical protein KDD51_13035 [Bdellovibrionales bacterium]|nr:hypothetical protein [Bdellovibrionales bacterium]